MRNCALNLARSGFIAFGLGLAGCGGTVLADKSQTPTAQLIGWSELRLVAEGSRGHRLDVRTTPGVLNHATGTVTLEGQTWQASDSDCADFRRALDEFQQLPLLRPGPALLQPNASADHPIPPRRLHDESWVIKTQLHAADFSSMDAEMRAPFGPYIDWANDTVTVIKECNRSALNPSD